MTPTGTPLQPLTLVRRPDDEVFKGVCAALGRATGTDPVLWRVATVVLTIFGGSGLLLYAAGWALIPQEGRGSVAERFLRRTPAQPITLILVAIAAAVLAGSSDGNNLLPLAVVGLVVYLVVKDGPVAPPTGPVQEWSQPPVPEPGTEVSWYTAPLDIPVTVTPVPVRRRRRAVLAGAVATAVPLVAAILLGSLAVGIGGLSLLVGLATALLLLCLGVLLLRRGRPLALLPVTALLAATVAGGLWLSSVAPLSSGDRTWVAQPGGRYELGAGTATLDLRRVTAPAAVSATLGVGRLDVLVPAGTHVDLRYDVSVGEVDRPGTVVSGNGLHETVTLGDPTTPAISLRVTMRAGRLGVRNAG